MKLLMTVAVATMSAIGPAVQRSASSSSDTATVSGVVIDGGTGSPVSEAIVEIRVNGRPLIGEPRRRQLTDAMGRFAFADLPASPSGSLSVRKVGYLDGGYGAGAADSAGSFALEAGERIADVRVQLWRPGVIGGTVVDESGAPVVGVLVQPLARIRVFGRDAYQAGSPTTTDDRGRYRISGLTPGAYLVQVPAARSAAPFPIPPPPLDGQPFAYPPSFAPGVSTLDAAVPVDLALGEQRTGVDVALAPLSAFRVSGQVEGPSEALAGAVLRLVPEGAERLGLGSEAAVAEPDARGRFAFPAVPAGAYTIDASRAVGEFRPPVVLTSAKMELSRHLGWGSIGMDVEAGPPGLLFSTVPHSSASQYWARQPIVVGGRDQTDVTVVMRPAGTMRGRVIEERAPGVRVPSLAPTVGIRLDPVEDAHRLGAPRSDSRPDGATAEFTIRGVLRGRFRLRTDHGWLVKSISWNGRDYTDAPFDATETQDLDGVQVVVTNDAATLRGQVHDDRGAPARNAVVVLFPALPALWVDIGLWPTSIRSVAASDRGAFEITGLRAGDYNVVAVPAPDPSSSVQVDSDFFRAAQGLATPVSVSWGESRTLSLSVRQVR